MTNFLNKDDLFYQYYKKEVDSILDLQNELKDFSHVSLNFKNDFFQAIRRTQLSEYQHALELHFIFFKCIEMHFHNITETTKIETASFRMKLSNYSGNIRITDFFRVENSFSKIEDRYIKQDNLESHLIDFMKSILLDSDKREEFSLMIKSYIAHFQKEILNGSIYVANKCDVIQRI